MLLTVLFQPIRTHSLAPWLLVSDFPATVQSWFSEIQITRASPEECHLVAGEGVLERFAHLRLSQKSQSCVLLALAW